MPEVPALPTRGNHNPKSWGSLLLRSLHLISSVCGPKRNHFGFCCFDFAVASATKEWNFLFSLN